MIPKKDLKKSYMNKITESDEKLLFSKVFDQAYLCLETGKTSVSPFLDRARSEKFFNMLSSGEIGLNISSFGGFDGAERSRLCFCEKEVTPDLFEIELVLAQSEAKYVQRLEHRAVLGSLIGLGLRREDIGDICVFSDKSFIFLDRKAAGIVLSSLTRIGSVQVDVKNTGIDELPPVFSDFRELCFKPDSLRLDGFVSHAFGCSRTEASQAVKSGKVYVNGNRTEKITKDVSTGDSITLRGSGKTIVQSVESDKNGFYVVVKKLV